jgi:hypothetical protein
VARTSLSEEATVSDNEHLREWYEKITTSQDPLGVLAQFAEVLRSQTLIEAAEIVSGLELGESEQIAGVLALAANGDEPDES